MVTLSRIYTKTGDQGETALGDFSRDKHDLALAQVGSCCGVVRSTRQVLEALS